MMALPKDPRRREAMFLGYVAQLPCVACMVRGVFNTRVQVAHLRAGSLEHGKRATGMQEKPSDRWCLPLCQPHHTGDRRRVRSTQHAGKEVQFWEALGINPFDLCVELYQAYEGGRAGTPIIALAAARGRRTMEEAAQARQS